MVMMILVQNAKVRVAERVAIVSGAGSAEGIGFAAAARLVRAGLRVVIGATSERIRERAAELEAIAAELHGSSDSNSSNTLSSMDSSPGQWMKTVGQTLWNVNMPLSSTSAIGRAA